ncbi:MAG: UDP-glucose 4-epimerase GalE [Balneolaceae bacterium]|jgi:UDP-glucose 4-epimerase|nr:UDP-glucose 4-epimerase GalE [Balneolaceae bacterium]
MTILVTGGAGYIGSHTCIELLNQGHKVVVVDNLVNSHSESLQRVEELTGKNIPFYAVDLSNEAEITKVFSEHSIEAVIHFAGLKAVGESVEQPIRYYDNNIRSTLVLCKLMQSFSVKHLVFSSSATVYGLAESNPIPETAPLSATNPYGRTKLFIEYILNDWITTFDGASVALLRYFNPVGAHASGRIGEDPQGIPNNLMPYITQVAAGRREKLSIFGNDYDTIDGTGVRDYIHVVDLAIGHVKALDALIHLTGSHVYNLGTGNGTSVLELVQAFQQATGQPIPYEISARRPGDVATCFADSSKAERELNWKAVRGIVEMCRDSWKWQKENPNGYK